MILTGESRGDWQECARRMMRRRPGESVRVVEAYGLAGDDVLVLFEQVASMSVLARDCEKHFYYATINLSAEEALTEEQWWQLHQSLSRALGFEECSRFVVERVRHGCVQRQVVWTRINWDGKLVSTTRDYRGHHKAARELEEALGVDVTFRRKLRVRRTRRTVAA